MFERLQATQSEPLSALIGAFKADARDNKIDVGVRVCSDDQGHTPVMAAVKQAERQWLDTQDSKAHLGLVGDANFYAAMTQPVFGSTSTQLAPQLRAVQTTGGRGALRALADWVATSRTSIAGLRSEQITRFVAVVLSARAEVK